MKKNIILILAFLLIGLLLGIYIGIYKNVYFSSEKYPIPIGRISLKGAIQLDSMKTYKGKTIIGYYHSSAPDIYQGSKYQFRQIRIGIL